MDLLMSELASLTALALQSDLQLFTIFYNYTLKYSFSLLKV